MPQRHVHHNHREMRNFGTAKHDEFRTVSASSKCVSAMSDTARLVVPSSALREHANVRKTPPVTKHGFARGGSPRANSRPIYVHEKFKEKAA